MTITRESIIALSEDIVAREIEGEIIIVPLAAGIGNMEDELYTLNQTGRAIWEQLDGKRSLGEIALKLSDEFDSPIEAILSDVLGLVTELVNWKILVETSAV